MDAHKKIRVFIVDDHPVFLRGLQLILDEDPSTEVVGFAHNGIDAISKIEQIKPQVIVLDVDMPKKDGFEVVKNLQEKQVGIPIIFLTMHNDEATVHAALDAGVMGYLLKDSASDDVVEAVTEVVVNNRHFVSPRLASYLINRTPSTVSLNFQLQSLTSTEIKILKLIAEKKTTKEIAQTLFVSPRTIDNHRYNICLKLEITGSNALLKFAMENRQNFV